MMCLILYANIMVKEGIYHDTVNVTRLPNLPMIITNLPVSHSVATAMSPCVHSEKSPVRPMLFYGTNYWHQFSVQFEV